MNSILDAKPEHRTNILPLRWVANYIFEPISIFFLKLYMRWGTTYVWEYVDDSPYSWNEDPETGDAWRLVDKHENVRDGQIIPEIQKEMK